MTRAAIERLADDPEGYVLMVEAGRIDHAHHYGNAYRALSDTVALSDAVAAALEATDARDTLVVVTADHSHTLTFAGYPARGNPILGLVRGFVDEGSGSGELARDALGLPYTTLGYANGPGYGGQSDRQAEGPKRYLHDFSAITRLRGGRPDPATVDTTAPDYLQDTAIPLVSETHGGDDVGVWAGGAGAEAFRGSIEQHAIFHLMLQSTPRLREFLCRKARCNADGVPVRRPSLSDLRP
jgi:alkaline phosphatase